ncbi:hypothetical protein Gohar_011550 [Gossypium harknessii]|uniref:Cytochrome b5 heme-binding domain-containing protein n=1 Tax=Gossypium harknessii TaxID=34285 RepID=A0A7J9GUA9_9ROSI|nr:hypothetical protein [Gossypium harknessii]
MYTAYDTWMTCRSNVVLCKEVDMVLLPVYVTGKDATDDFEDVGHSDSARDMLDQYYVGEIDISTIPTKTTYKPPNSNQDK